MLLSDAPKATRGTVFKKAERGWKIAYNHPKTYIWKYNSLKIIGLLADEILRLRQKTLTAFYDTMTVQRLARSFGTDRQRNIQASCQ